MHRTAKTINKIYQRGRRKKKCYTSYVYNCWCPCTSYATQNFRFSFQILWKSQSLIKHTRYVNIGTTKSKMGCQCVANIFGYIYIPSSPADCIPVNNRNEWTNEEVSVSLSLSISISFRLFTLGINSNLKFIFCLTKTNNHACIHQVQRRPTNRSSF